MIPETEERLSRFEEYYWLAKIRRPYEPPLGYANSQYSTKQIWHSDIMRPSRIKLLILCCWKHFEYACSDFELYGRGQTFKELIA